jgi:hypothetical protein
MRHPSLDASSTTLGPKKNRDSSIQEKKWRLEEAGVAIEEITDSIPESFHRSLLGGPEEGFEFGEDLLDRIEIRAIGREKEEARSSSLNRLCHAPYLVASQVVHDDDVSGPQRGSEALLDVSSEDLPVDRPVDYQRSG